MPSHFHPMKMAGKRDAKLRFLIKQIVVYQYITSQ